VVNLSLGGHGNAHDGTDSLSQAINQEVGQGRIVCCSAGNEGSDNIHAQATCQVGQTTDISLRISDESNSDPNAVSGNIFLNGWYSGGDELEVAVQSPSGFITPFQSIEPSGNGKQYKHPEGRIEVYNLGPNPFNNDHNIFIAIKSPTPEINSKVTTGVWRIKLRGKSIVNGRVDFWAMDQSDKVNVVFLAPNADNSMTIGSPGSASGAITVASYTTRVSWSDTNGDSWSVGHTPNTPSEFSSEGPLRNGDLKPDVSAPGAFIAAPLSADSNPQPHWVIRDNIRLMQGTSMSAPFMSGLVALLLERSNNLDPSGTKAIIKDNSSIPGQSQGKHDNKWGYGLVETANI
jgi:subtilisin family serine protease